MLNFWILSKILFFNIKLYLQNFEKGQGAIER